MAQQRAALREYIANLRAIGCPEKTIKEIIKADVNDLFSARRATITQSNHYEYWRAIPVSLNEEQRRQLQQLCIEKNEVLKALGIDSSELAEALPPKNWTRFLGSETREL